MRWPQWAHEMAKDGDLLMVALTNTPPCPVRRSHQIRRRLCALDAERIVLEVELGTIWEASGILNGPEKAAGEPAQ